MELDTLVRRHGATAIAWGWQEDLGLNEFRFQLKGHIVKLAVREPAKEEYARDGQGHKRSPKNLESALDKERRRRWRVLVIVVKAKLELIEGGDSTVEREFLADLLLPDMTTTVADEVLPKLEEAHKKGRMPSRLFLPPGGDK